MQHNWKEQAAQLYSTLILLGNVSWGPNPDHVIMKTGVMAAEKSAVVSQK